MRRYFETFREMVWRGLGGGTVLGLWFGVVYLLDPRAAFARYEMTLGQGVAVGVVGGGGAGLVAGLLAPLGRYLVGAILVGALALVPFVALFSWARTGHLDWTLVVLTAVPLGGGLGAVCFVSSRTPVGGDPT